MKITSTFTRIVRRYWVPRSEYDKAIETLREAYSLILRHHNVSKPIELGCACPHCTDDKGESTVLDRIVNLTQARHGPSD